MEEIYWLQRLGSINTLMWVVFAISIGLTIIFGAVWCVNTADGDDDNIVCSKIFKSASIAMIISCLGGIFVPTTNEMYAIYGIGGTIDYLKENETAKQLPDKVINALDKWIDGINEDKEK